MTEQQNVIVLQSESASADEFAVLPVVAQVPDSTSIAALAYQLWQARGCPEGSPDVDWLGAEQILSNQSAQPESPSIEPPALTRQVGA